MSVPRGDGPGPSSSVPAPSAMSCSSSPAAPPTAPPLPARPENPESEAPPDLPPRPERERDDSPHPAFTDPQLGPRPAQEEEEEEDYSFPDVRGRSPPRGPDSTPPPRRRLTSKNIPTNSIGYARDPERVIAYLIPLPAPMRQGQQMNVPQRYMIYTPPAAHLLKPEGKEGKRHKAKRIAQQEVRKAKTYEGKTLSLRGLHSKGLRGVDWAAAAVRDADVTFLNRVPRRRVGELVLLHPAPSPSPSPSPASQGQGQTPAQTPAQTHAEFAAQLGRARRRAAAHSLASVALFPPAVALDTLAVVFWPFGGLAEVDAAWAWASISGYLTARSVTRRLDQASMVTTVPPSAAAGAAGAGSPPAEEGRPDRYGRQVRFEEDLGEEEEEDDDDEKLQGGGRRKSKRSPLKVRFVPDEAMATMESYFQEACHRRNPRVFKSPGVPPTQTDVLASMGWWPDRRGRAPGVEHEEDWDDENWQTRQVKEDLDRVMKKAAKKWDKWCKSYGKYPERAMGEKGHSMASEVMRKLRIKKGMPPTGTKQGA